MLRDRRMETGNKKTIYIFNLKRGEIIEYALEIVEQKLRELKADESGYINELEAGYKKARRPSSGVVRLNAASRIPRGFYRGRQWITVRMTTSARTIQTYGWSPWMHKIFISRICKL